MPVVTLTASKTLNGPAVNDLLNGGASGVDIGTVANDAVSNTVNLYVRHNGANKITGASFFVQAYTGTYGGNYTPTADYAKLQGLGDTNNGLQFDEDWDRTVPFNVLYQVKTGDGDSFATRRAIAATSMVRDNAGSEADATAPVVGEIGPALNATLGDNAHLKYRIKIPASETDGGIRQYDTVIAYNYTT